MSVPSRRTRPLSDISKAAIIVKVVVFPDPLGPSNEMNSPKIRSEATRIGPMLRQAGRPDHRGSAASRTGLSSVPGYHPA